MITGNKNIDSYIFLFLGDDDFLNLRITCKYFYDLCDENVFRNWLNIRYNDMMQYYYTEALDLSYVLQYNLSWKCYTLENLYHIRKLKKMGFTFSTGEPKIYRKIIEQSHDGKQMLYEAGHFQYYDMINYALNNEGVDKFDNEKDEIKAAFNCDDSFFG
jgi:hypothetical protein